MSECAAGLFIFFARAPKLADDELEVLERFAESSSSVNEGTASRARLRLDGVLIRFFFSGAEKFTELEQRAGLQNSWISVSIIERTSRSLRICIHLLFSSAV